jgi:hypothetical protein
MTRARYAALALGALLAGPAHAVDVPRPTPPPDQVDVVEPHRYSPWIPGVVGVAGGALAIAGIALLSDSYNRYLVELRGGDADSCRPCSTSRLTGLKAEYGAGYALIGAGVVFGIAAGIVAKLDSNYRRDHMRVSKVQLTPTGLRF